MTSLSSVTMVGASEQNSKSRDGSLLVHGAPHTLAAILTQYTSDNASQPSIQGDGDSRQDD
jgi:hypothetical protein